MITGCLTAVAASYYSGSVWIGMLAAAIVSGLFGLIFGVLAIEFRVNQVVLGVAFNLVGAGLTTTLNRAFFNGLVIKAHFAQDPLGFTVPIYIAILLVILMWFFLQKTKLGIQIRAVGENPIVVESVGISVKKLRYAACIAGGILSGIGGAYLSTGLLSEFTESMTEGRGFIALAAVTFGKYGPFGTLGGVAVFGLGEMLSYRLQVMEGSFPYEFALMLPYVLTILALCIFSRNGHDPTSLGVPYKKNR